MVAPVPISIGNNEWIVAAVPYSSPTAAAERDVWTRSGRVSSRRLLHPAATTMAAVEKHPAET